MDFSDRSCLVLLKTLQCYLLMLRVQLVVCMCSRCKDLRWRLHLSDYHKQTLGPEHNGAD